MFKVLVDGCKPTKGSKYSACVDLYASEDVVIGAGKTKLIGLVVCVDENNLKSIGGEYVGDGFYEDFLNSHYLQLMLRSSLGKKGLMLSNGVGVIDLDYKDEIKMIIYNSNFSYERDFAEAPMNVFKDYDDIFTIKKGDKIAQITLLEHKSYLFGIESDVERSGGFGSTD